MSFTPSYCRPVECDTVVASVSFGLHHSRVMWVHGTLGGELHPTTTVMGTWTVRQGAAAGNQPTRTDFLPTSCVVHWITLRNDYRVARNIKWEETRYKNPPSQLAKFPVRIFLRCGESENHGRQVIKAELHSGSREFLGHKERQWTVNKAVDSEC